ncbi:MAG: maleylacetoacetate isomerase [Boseongicola sp. SB0677_bin_26]|nr:maleylacetoacetate isomerase [Boseongicola sp. SB0665_bin_10]MYG27689.1 maleylacetoacetate isomerase [Boseongicola sp. SB0677_bin_26]
MNAIVLYDYPRSTASYRVRIALNLAGLSYEQVMVNLLEDEQSAPEHLARSPQGFVPVLDIDGHRFIQSLAILEYLDSTRGLALVPDDPVKRARAMGLAMVIAVDLHPVCNLSVSNRATGGEEPARTEWMQEFIGNGLTAFEAMLGGFEQAPFCTGDRLGLADLCLVPQLYNADRWGIPLDELPRIRGVREACDRLPAFAEAHPDRQG